VTTDATGAQPRALVAGAVPVERVDVAAYTVPTDAPEADGTASWRATTLVVVQVHGGGETGTGWTYGPPACGFVVHDLLADAVRGRSAWDTAGCWQAMVAEVRNAGRPGVAGCAVSAVDVALWDLKARLIGLPLHRLLGADDVAVRVYGSGGFTTYDDDRLAEQLGAWVGELGVGAVKIKIGESRGTRVPRDLARTARARDLVGGQVELLVDANGGYTRKQAVRVGGALDDLGVVWFEEPVSSDDLDGLREVRDAVRADVAAGEYAYDLPYVQRMCASGAVDCMQLDLSRCGGISEWLRAAAVAAAHGLDVSGHCAPHLHLAAAAATANLRHLEWFHDHVRIEQLAFDGAAVPRDGALHPDPDRPGHGLVPRWPDLARYRVA
jgi:L-alanine-DL-glutamate epimerase-like enolase superfamily enzyme